MTHDPHGMAALRAAIDASRSRVAPAHEPVPSSRTNPAGVWRDIDAAAMSLLWRIRTNFSEAPPAVLQFSPCAADGNGSDVAHAFARAAAAAIGRTLLINAREATTPGPLPDAFVPRLYHQSIAGNALFSLLGQQPDGARPTGGMFKVIVLDQTSPAINASACITAPLCNGTILVVDRGITELAAIKAAAARIGAMGGSILGAVLAGVPCWT